MPSSSRSGHRPGRPRLAKILGRVEAHTRAKIDRLHERIAWAGELLGSPPEAPDPRELDDAAGEASGRTDRAIMADHVLAHFLTAAFQPALWDCSPSPTATGVRRV